MKTDRRILNYTQAAERMSSGQFPVAIQVEGADEVARLGESLRALGDSLEHRFQEMAALARITTDINAGLVLDEVLERLYESFSTLLPYDRIGVALLEERGDGEPMVSARWARAEGHLKLTRGYSAVLRGSSLEPIIATGQPRILNDLHDYLEQHPHSTSTRMVVREGVRSSLTCPLIAMGKPLGFIFFSSYQPQTYTHVHVGLYQQIAGQLAITLEKGRLYEQLLELNQLKSRFLGMAAHDLRNPIGVVKGYMSVLHGGALGALNPRQQEAVARVDQTCEQMLGLINEFLDISAIESGQIELHPQPVAVLPYLARIAEQGQLLAQAKRITCEVTPGEDPGSVSFDPERIEQVLGNLISNAIKFSHSGTTIRLSALRKPQALELCVTDQGQGIAPEEMSLLFRDFSRTSTQATAGERSTGLGLAICKRIVQAHGGQIWCESEPGKGSRFYLQLPVPLADKTGAARG